MRIWLRALFVFAIGSLAAACTTIDNDPNTTYVDSLYHTRIDFQPLHREDLVVQVAAEKQIFAQRKEQIEERLSGLKAEHELRYKEIEDQFGDCAHQRHCTGDMAKGKISRFERYNQVLKSLNEVDAQIATAQGLLKQLGFRYSLRSRALYNRFLVNELLSAKGEDPRIEDILIHALEAYPTRLALSQQLARMVDPEVPPQVYGDLNFQMMGRPVDEAAVLATYDVKVRQKGSDSLTPSRFLVTFLVNTFQLDAMAYNKDFLHAWAGIMAEPEQRRLKDEVFCGLYSIAGETLVPRLSPGKAKPCAPLRLRQQARDANHFADRFSPDAWFLPISFTPVK